MRGPFRKKARGRAGPWPAWPRGGAWLAGPWRGLWTGGGAAVHRSMVDRGRRWLLRGPSPRGPAARGPGPRSTVDRAPVQGRVRAQGRRRAAVVPWAPPGASAAVLQGTGERADGTGGVGATRRARWRAHLRETTKSKRSSTAAVSTAAARAWRERRRRELGENGGGADFEARVLGGFASGGWGAI